ncbi:MAG: sigma-54 dependent transcriptional regulator [Gammaproteobacteria bacterium]
MSTAQSQTKQAVVLMVDDNPDNLGVLFELLNQHDFRVLVAEDGESALAQAAYVHPDLILLDILLPDMDGFTTCQRLKERPETQDIPIIFMSALTDTVDKIKGFQLGAVDYITKPFQQQEVLARVTTHVTLQRLKRQLMESEQRLSRMVASAMDAIVILDREGRITLFNRAAERVFRCQEPEALGQPFTRFLSKPCQQILLDYLQQGERAGNRLTPFWMPGGQTAMRADGESFPIEATVSRAEVNRCPLYTVILRDVGERQRAEAERNRLRGLNLYLQEELQAAQQAEELVGAAQGLQSVMTGVRQVANTDATVLISGETGTGKELIARAIHGLSSRKDKVMVKLNCAAIPSGLVESELFGHEKGAFTGAIARKVGRFELADGGTLFLDEVGELSLDLQAKLLRVLQEGEFERVGGTRTLTVDVRIIAATNRDLTQCAKDGAFRPDLYYRLNVFPIPLPPLRERKEDLPLFIEHFVRRYAKKYGKRIETVPERAMKAMYQYDWPGNVRELQHVIERAVILTQDSELAFDDCLKQAPSSTPSAPTGVEPLQQIERAHILRALESTGWRVSGRNGAAEVLGLKPTTLESRMKKLGITRR